MLDGTNRGAAADASGFYIILNIAPGKYSLTAQMIGFKGITKTDVTVNSDRTTKVNFELDEEAIGMEEVRVCLLYTSPSPRDGLLSRMPSSA